MENAITGLIIIGLLILVAVGLTDRSLSAQAAISEASRTMQERVGVRARTNVAPLSAVTTDGGNRVDITLRNSGNVKLADFSQWDVILQYTDFGATPRLGWFTYSSGAGAPGQWTKDIYQIATSSPEVFDPGILNPGEEMVIKVQVNYTVGSGTTNRAAIATPNGITASAVFTR